MSDDWERKCKPYADKLDDLFKGRGYFAVVDDERGTFVVIGGRKFDAPNLKTAFNLAWPFAQEYIAVSGTNKELYNYWRERNWGVKEPSNCTTKETQK